jgi:hypothetical protein
VSTGKRLLTCPQSVSGRTFVHFKNTSIKKFLAYIGKLKITLFWLSLVRRPGTGLTRNLGWFNQTVKSCLEFYTMHDLAILELNSEFCTISDHLKVATFKWYVNLRFRCSALTNWATEASCRAPIASSCIELDNWSIAGSHVWFLPEGPINIGLINV